MDKPKVDEKYIKNRLSEVNLINYLIDNFGKPNFVETKTIVIQAFLQKNYGGIGDCTLTSILELVMYYKPELNDNEVYNYIEKIAKKYLYRENFGTSSFFNKLIIKEVFKHFNINKSVTSKYIKNIGFKKEDIVKILKTKTPIILSLTNDGRNYYMNHTITIIGYTIYKINGKNKLMLKVHDN